MTDASPEREYHPKAYPAWYRYHDEYHGTGHLLDLPDVRGERQRFYEQLARAEQERLRPAPTHDCDTRPWPTYEDRDALFDEFTRRFDPTRHLIDLHRQYVLANYRHPDEDAVFMSTRVLVKEGNSLPLTEAYPDWRPALIDLANGIRREHLAAAMPAAFARYTLCIESGLRPPPPCQTSAFDEENPIPLIHHREEVLRGRELNGEARDFEF